MENSLYMTTFFPVSPQRVYSAWLDSSEHQGFTGSPAKIDPTVGGAFTAWDGYIWGKSVELDPGEKIVQTWRTDDFPKNSPDSILEISLAEKDGGTQLTLIHTQIPEGQADQYEEGWIDYYFTPMKEYFSK
jgi:activator of HSP90 ATPase